MNNEINRLFVVWVHTHQIPWHMKRGYFWAISHCIHIFQPQVLAIGPECDIALLSVEDEAFWKGVEPLRFGSLPRLQVAQPSKFLLACFSHRNPQKEDKTFPCDFELSSFVCGEFVTIVQVFVGCCHCGGLPNRRRLHFSNKWCRLPYWGKSTRTTKFALLFLILGVPSPGQVYGARSLFCLCIWRILIVFHCRLQYWILIFVSQVAEGSLC